MKHLMNGLFLLGFILASTVSAAQGILLKGKIIDQVIVPAPPGAPWPPYWPCCW
ncbi:hypothetical protein [Hymenobacter elongatus]|uniref:hypothetical protein n=1 Tax=Hymenobacter elongatus TaxID=877208 RepID=UPI00143683E0|nr:hypothetical protein [Hymenobacter elongatus]